MENTRKVNGVFYKTFTYSNSAKTRIVRSFFVYSSKRLFNSGCVNTLCLSTESNTKIDTLLTLLDTNHVWKLIHDMFKDAGFF